MRRTSRAHFWAGVLGLAGVAAAIGLLALDSSSEPENAAAETAAPASIGQVAEREQPKDFSTFEDLSSMRVAEDVANRHGLSLYNVEDVSGSHVIRYLSESAQPETEDSPRVSPEKGVVIVVSNNVLFAPESVGSEETTSDIRSVKVSGHDAELVNDGREVRPSLAVSFSPKDGVLVSVKALVGLNEAEILEISEALEW